ncbi:MAG: LysM peptidoglycan-binding domain-containing protein [Halanaerobiales bacterium]|nr:LysM peptidoglycan-binding domain-containing protein [Halanaerobiales bacterium]
MYWKQCPIKAMPYTIKPGDTLYKIALEYNTTPQQLLFLNPAINPNNLMVGQIICVPKKPTKPSCTKGFYYTIEQGDSLYSIATKYGLSVNELLPFNPGIDPTNLYIGQIICIPKKVKCPNGQFYTVEENDTFLLIAIKFDRSYNALRKANPNLDLDNLQEGQQICIPPSKPSKVCPDDRTYLIKEGDTLSSIAEKFVISATDMLKVNPNMTPSEFVAGRLICLPPEAPV